MLLCYPTLSVQHALEGVDAASQNCQAAIVRIWGGSFGSLHTNPNGVAVLCFGGLMTLNQPSVYSPTAGDGAGIQSPGESCVGMPMGADRQLYLSHARRTRTSHAERAGRSHWPWAGLFLLA